MIVHRILIGWGLFLVVVYATMAIDAMRYNRRARRTLRQFSKFINEEEEDDAAEEGEEED